MNELTKAAVGYIEFGLRVIALEGKRPNTLVHRAWLDDSFTQQSLESDGRRFDAAFRHPRTTGVGIVIDYPYVVVDIDSEAGAVNWRDLVGDDAFIPDRWTAKTAHGVHVWYSSVQPTGSFKPFGPDGGVDLKGQKSYVAAPPSWHPGYPDEGLPPGNHYQWLAEPDREYPAFDVPDPLADKIKEHNEISGQRTIGKQMRRPVPVSDQIDGLFYAAVSFDGLIRRMAEEPDGNRNNVLYWAARTMTEEGATDDDIKRLLDTAVSRGLNRREARSTIRSGIEAAARE